MKTKAEPKFKEGDLVEADSLIETLVVNQAPTYRTEGWYGCPDWFYTLAFATKKGKPDQRRNFRFFPESRLTLKK